MSNFQKGQRVRILVTAWPGSNEPEDVAARGQLATLDSIMEPTPPALWNCVTDDGEMHAVTEEEIEAVQSAIFDLPQFPRPWHVRCTLRHKVGGWNQHIMSADDLYVAEGVSGEGVADYIVAVVNEHEVLRARLARAYQENAALVERHNEIDDALAAALARAEAAEAKLAAVPVSALMRTLFTGYRSDEQIGADADAINAWAAKQREVQP